MIDADFGDGFGDEFLDDDDLNGGWDDDEPIQQEPVRSSRRRGRNDHYEEPEYDEPVQNTRQRGRRARPQRRKQPPRTRHSRANQRPRPPPVYEESHGADGGFEMPFSGVSGHVAEMAANEARNRLTSFVGNHSFMSFDYYRPLFAVSDMYVTKKLMYIFLPFMNKDWSRRLVSRSGQKTYANPREDNNAPDGYIVLMAFITFVIVVSISVGLHDKDSFSPDLMGAKVSSVLGIMFLETVVMKTFYYFIDISETGPGWLEQFCYSGYKLVLVILNIIVYLFSLSLNGYRAFALFTGLSAAYFMVQTLKPYFEIKSANMKPFLAFVTVLEVLLVFLLGSLAATADPSTLISSAETTTTTTTTTTLESVVGQS